MRKLKFAAMSCLMLLVVSSSNAMSATNTLADDISIQISSHPYFGRYHIQVETFGSLAVLHGWVLHSSERRAIVDRVKRMEGVERVYSYIITDDTRIDCGPMTSDDIVRTMNKAQRVQMGIANAYDQIRDLGIQFDSIEGAHINRPAQIDYAVVETPLIGIPETAAAAVKANLTLDDVTSIYNLQVDSYAGIVFLHGWVPNDGVADDAKQIAARTPGVRQVVSYMGVGESTGEVIVGPVEVALFHPDERPRYRTQPSEPQYVRYNRRPDFR
jgi:osmotically-inducible protein OsmY